MVEPEVRAYEFGPFRLDVAERRLLREGRPLPITPKSFDILLLLVRNRGQLVTKETLMGEVWPDSFVGENNLTVGISSLRKALGERQEGREYIETLPKRGYRFVARARAVAAEGVGRPSAVPVRAEASASVSGTAVGAVAVLPLVNTGDDPNLEYLSDGITESIINSLSGLPRLRVMARSTVFGYKGRELEPQRIGRELNVDAVVVGRLRLFNERLLLGVELVDVADGSQLWGEQYNRGLSDVFKLQEEIAHEVSEKLRIRLTGEERLRLAKRHTENSEAYHLYLKGRYSWNRRTVKGFNQGLRYFNEAVAVDDRYALAYAGLADCYVGLTVGNELPAREGLAAARRAAVKALELDEMVADAHAALAYVEMLSWNWSEADAEFRRAVELNPNSVLTRTRYSSYLAILGQTERAVWEAEQALDTDPLSPLMHVSAGRIFFYARRYESAIERCRDALEMESSFGPAHGLLALVYERMGRHEEAIAEMRQAVGLLRDDPEALGILGFLYGVSGRSQQARKVLGELRELSKRKYVTPLYMACVHIGLREKEAAFKLLFQTYEERSPILTHMTVLPIFDFLRPDPRFTNLLSRIGLAARVTVAR